MVRVALAQQVFYYAVYRVYNDKGGDNINGVMHMLYQQQHYGNEGSTQRYEFIRFAFEA